MNAVIVPARGRITAMTRRIALLSFVMLVLTQLLDSWVRQPPLIIWLMGIVPLLIFVPGLVRDAPRTYVWLCFVILMYFVILVLHLFADPHNPVAWTGMVSVVSLFIAAMMYARWRSQELKMETANE